MIGELRETVLFRRNKGETKEQRIGTRTKSEKTMKNEKKERNREITKVSQKERKTSKRCIGNLIPEMIKERQQE